MSQGGAGILLQSSLVREQELTAARLIKDSTQLLFANSSHESTRFDNQLLNVRCHSTKRCLVQCAKKESENGSAVASDVIISATASRYSPGPAASPALSQLAKATFRSCKNPAPNHFFAIVGILLQRAKRAIQSAR